MDGAIIQRKAILQVILIQTTLIILTVHHLTRQLAYLH